MHDRISLHNTLKTILGSGNVYFQAPPNIRLQYPAIVYKRSGIRQLHADSKKYGNKIAYQVTLIDKNPDSEFVIALANLPYCRHVRSFISDELNHDIFEIYI